MAPVYATGGTLVLAGGTAAADADDHRWADLGFRIEREYEGSDDRGRVSGLADELAPRDTVSVRRFPGVPALRVHGPSEQKSIDSIILT